jgi:hypothetical protein
LPAERAVNGRLPGQGDCPETTADERPSCPAEEGFSHSLTM